ncbi:MAG: ECF transporter S component [Microbacterium sp.]
MSGRRSGTRGGVLRSIGRQFTTKTLVLIPIAVGINIVGGSIAAGLKLPLFLDMIGTILAAALGGPWVGAAVGLLTNVFLALVANPIYFPYAIVSVTVGLTTGFLIHRGFFRRIRGVIVVWLVVTFVSVVLASLVTIFVFGGASGVTGASVITATLIAASQKIVESVFASAFIENLVDRGISFFIAYVLMKRIPRRFLSQYSQESLDDADDDEL